MSNQEFADHLNRNFGSVNIGGNAIEAREVTTDVLPNGAICFSLMFDNSNIVPLLQPGPTEDLMTWEIGW